MKPSAFSRVWTVPIVLAALTVFGLLAALLGTGDKGHRYFRRRSSSAWAKNALAGSMGRCNNLAQLTIPALQLLQANRFSAQSGQG